MRTCVLTYLTLQALPRASLTYTHLNQQHQTPVTNNYSPSLGRTQNAGVQHIEGGPPASELASQPANRLVSQQARESVTARSLKILVFRLPRAIWQPASQPACQAGSWYSPLLRSSKRWSSAFLRWSSSQPAGDSASQPTSLLLLLLLLLPLLLLLLLLLLLVSSSSPHCPFHAVLKAAENIPKI